MASPRSGRVAGPPGEPRAIGYLYIAPAFLVFALFMLWPLARAVWLSFYEWDGLSVGTWVGIANYRDIVSDDVLRSALVHAFVLVLFYSVIPVSVGLLLAALMSHTTLRWLGFFRSVLFLPQVIASVVIAIAWQRIYAPDGPLNDALRAVGLDPLAHDWLGFGTALPAVGFVGAWVGTGLCLVLFLAGIAKIPRELYEAARLDGAGAVQEFFAVTLPSVRGELAVALTLTVIAALRTFDIVYVMTKGGGPGTETTVPSYEVFHRAFELRMVGQSAAIAVTLTALMMVVTVLINRVNERTEP